MFKCDKCGLPVEPQNDAVSLQYVLELGRLPETMEQFMYGARHLLPTDGCEGSPSRAQYLEGQPRDTRGYSLVQKNVEPFRQAYARLCEISGSLKK